MSTITLNLPKPLRPGMAWVIAGIVIFLLATTLVTRNNANVKFAANAPLTARQSNMEGYLDEQSVGGLLAPPERKIVHTCSLDLTVSSPSQTAEQVRLLAEKLGGYLEMRSPVDKVHLRQASQFAFLPRSLNQPRQRSASSPCGSKARKLTPLMSPNNTWTCRRVCATCGPKRPNISRS